MYCTTTKFTALVAGVETEILAVSFMKTAPALDSERVSITFPTWGIENPSPGDLVEIAGAWMRAASFIEKHGPHLTE